MISREFLARTAVVGTLALTGGSCSESACSDGSKPKRTTAACTCANGLEVSLDHCEPLPAGSDDTSNVIVRDFGEVSSTPRTQSDALPAVGDVRAHRFSLRAPSTTTITATHRDGRPVSLKLFRDLDVIDPNASLFTVAVSASSGTQRIQAPLPRGAYQLRVAELDPLSSGSSYELSLAASAYRPTEAEPDPGGNPEGAQKLDTLGASPTLVGGYVGVLDVEDYYRLELGTAGSLVLDAVSLLGGRAVVQLFDDAPIINETAPRYVMIPAPNGDQRLAQVLPPGRYFLRVAPSDNTAGLLYTLRASVTPYADSQGRDPGGQKESALDLASLPEKPEEATGYVGLIDPEDYYRLTVDRLATVTVDAVNVQGGRLAVQLFEDAPIINEIAPRLSVIAYPEGDQRISTPLPAGIYYLRVSPVDGGSALYTLRYSARSYGKVEPAPEPGAQRDRAHDLGNLEAPRSVSGYVGPLDAEDYFRFTVSDQAAFTLDATGIEGGKALVQLLPDEEVINESMPLQFIAPYPSGDLRISARLAAGAYFVRITPFDGTTPLLYELTLRATP